MSPQIAQTCRSRRRIRSRSRWQAQPEGLELEQREQRVSVVGRPQPTLARSITATRRTPGPPVARQLPQARVGTGDRRGRDRQARADLRPALDDEAGCSGPARRSASGRSAASSTRPGAVARLAIERVPSRQQALGTGHDGPSCDVDRSGAASGGRGQAPRERRRAADDGVHGVELMSSARARRYRASRRARNWPDRSPVRLRRRRRRPVRPS
jgi:hypothetical protein